MSIIENPFLNNKTTITYFDESEGTNIEINQTNAHKYVSNVYVLVKKNNTFVPCEFYNMQVDKDIFEQVNSALIIYKVNVAILKNKNHFDSCIIMSDKQLKEYNIFNYELTSKNIIVPIFNIEYKNLCKYLEQYESTNTLQNIYNTKVLNEYFNIDNTKSNDFICQIINNLKYSLYWTNENNCLINMTSKFKDRTFSFQSMRMTDKNIASIVNKIFDKKITNDAKKADYIKEIDIKTNDKNDYKYHNSESETDNSFTHHDINQLFSVLNEKQQFILFANLIVSKKFCALVINNKHILKIMKQTIKTFAPLFKYLMSYAWIRFYIDENTKKTWTKTSDDFIFDIDTASELPDFPFNPHKPKENPYSPILVSDIELNPSENICGINDYSHLYDSNKICNLDEFRFRMNIFCTGNSEYNLFDGFDFNKYKVGITGSLITACIQKFHPLMSRFLNCSTHAERFTKYFNEYYASSDIDVMFMAKDNFEFIKNVKVFYNNIIQNIYKINGDHVNPLHIKLILNKIGYIFVNESFIINNIKFDEDIGDKVKYVIDNINEDSIKLKFRPYYEQLCTQKYNELIKNYSDTEITQLKETYPDFFTLDNVDFRIYVNQNTNKFKSTKNYVCQNNTDEINLVFTYKYTIESPYLIHNLELFSIKYDDFFSVVSKFHLPCVRGYYNGSNVYLTPSCISAHMTYMNLDYKYITGSKDPFDIINKNRMRGFGTWLNQNEKKLFVKYSREVPFWNNLYTINQKATEQYAINSIVGTVSLNHKIFRPRLYNMESYTNNIFVDTINRYNDSVATSLFHESSSITECTQRKFKSIEIKGINWDNFVSIDKYGYIVPLKKWIIDATWNIYVSDYKTSELKHGQTYEPKNSINKFDENMTFTF
jgi:hypothetical protein